MGTIEINSKLIGQRVKFKAITRWNTRTAVRLIKDIRHSSNPPNGALYDRGVIVRFGGYGDFFVRADEIIDIL